MRCLCVQGVDLSEDIWSLHEDLHGEMLALKKELQVRAVGSVGVRVVAAV